MIYSFIHSFQYRITLVLLSIGMMFISANYLPQNKEKQHIPVGSYRADAPPQDDFEKLLSSTYPNIFAKYKNFSVGVKAKFFNNFGNVTPKALQRFNEYYKTIDASGNPKSNLAYGVDLWLKYQETFNLQPFKALGEVPMTELQEATEEITTVKQKAIIQTAILYAG